jgi:hypothetical protein
MLLNIDNYKINDINNVIFTQAKNDLKKIPILKLLKIYTGKQSKESLTQQIESLKRLLYVESHSHKRMIVCTRIYTKLKKLMNRLVDEEFIQYCENNSIKLHPNLSRKKDPSYYKYPNA